MLITDPIVYFNGNVRVQLLADGTKIREYEGTPNPVHPESIDLKITDWCDAGCVYCHESSTTRGKHASLENIIQILDGIPAGVELAIGGGDPFSHPQIAQILSEVANRGIVANVTVNGRHLKRHAEAIREFRKANLLNGLGVSYHKDMLFENVADDNTIVHFIAGEHRVPDVLHLLKTHKKILVLGYKNYGRGVRHHSPKIEANLKVWRYWIGSIMRSGHVCFDNLGISQMNVSEWLEPDTYSRCYMGDDGRFTMYVDGVRDEYAVSSTSTRHPRNQQSLVEMFQHVQNVASVPFKVITEKVQ